MEKLIKKKEGIPREVIQSSNKRVFQLIRAVYTEYPKISNQQFEQFKYWMKHDVHIYFPGFEEQYCFEKINQEINQEKLI